MKRLDERRICYVASDLAHYIGDAHVPLHTIVDYDGVARGQRGVHERWESSMTERFGHSYTFPTVGAAYIDDPLASAFQIILESYTFADSIFEADLLAQRAHPDARRIERISSRGDTTYTYDDAYYASLAMYERGLAERRMQRAAIAIASYWYTAWVNSDKPDLSLSKHR
jgi:hypothetical protein